MDKALFIGMGSQKNSMQELEILSNNLANVNTPGFRADYEVTKQHHITNNMESRIYSSTSDSYSDFQRGPTLRTGRELDLAIAGAGMFAVQSRNGSEGYTRAGNFGISPDGFLTTANGQMVMGVSGPINIPPAEKMQFSEDGTVSILPRGDIDMVIVGQLKMVDPRVSDLKKGLDGLFYNVTGAAITRNENVKIEAGALEGSNVNPVETLVKLIDLSRNYEIHSNFIKNLGEQATNSNKLLDVKE